MPELPEVEVVRRGLADHVISRTVHAVSVHHPRAVRRHLAGPDDFVAQLAGRTFSAASRRGKYLWIELDGGTAGPAEQAVLVHLGMSGQLLVQPAAAPDETHLRIRITLDGGSELRFVDQRTFGALSVEQLVGADLDGGAGHGADSPVAALPAPVAHIARDPFDPAYDVEAVVAALRRRNTGLKRALLDQTLVSGIGNIYADEALWHSRLHWARQTATLNRPEARRVLAAAGRVMAAAMHEGGTSFDALYVDINGQSGYFERSLAVYGREGEPCRRCGAAVRRDPFMNRSSYSCPRCQPRPRRAHR